MSHLSNYQILGIPSGTDKESIKSAYRALAKRHHPDKGGSSEEFMKIQTAYEQLLKGITGENKIPDMEGHAYARPTSGFRVRRTFFESNGDFVFIFELFNIKSVSSPNLYTESEFFIFPRDVYTYRVSKKALKRNDYNITIWFWDVWGFMHMKEYNIRKPEVKKVSIFKKILNFVGW